MTQLVLSQQSVVVAAQLYVLKRHDEDIEQLLGVENETHSLRIGFRGLLTQGQGQFRC